MKKNKNGFISNEMWHNAYAAVGYYSIAMKINKDRLSMMVFNGLRTDIKDYQHLKEFHNGDIYKIGIDPFYISIFEQVSELKFLSDVNACTPRSLPDAIREASEVLDSADMVLFMDIVNDALAKCVNTIYMLNVLWILNNAAPRSFYKRISPRPEDFNKVVGLSQERILQKMKVIFPNVDNHQLKYQVEKSLSYLCIKLDELDECPVVKIGDNYLITQLGVRALLTETYDMTYLMGTNISATTTHRPTMLH